MKNLLYMAGVVALGAMSMTASAQFTETEANDTKATANVFSGLTAGATITGLSTGTSTTTPGLGSADYYRISMASAVSGIYRYRMVLTTAGTVGHTATIRGLGQTAATPGPWPGPVGTPTTTDATAQTASTTLVTGQRINQWYGFGAANDLYYRVTGTASTTADYVATLERTTVTPTFVGTYNAGLIDIRTFGQGHTTDTDLWIYDSNFNPIAGYGNDDESTNSHIGGSNTGATLTSILRRNYAPGRYYLALSNFALSNNMTSPSDDDFRTGTILDFGGSVLNSSTTANLNISFAINGNQIQATKVGQFDVNFYEFEVVPEPGTMAALGLGALAMIRRRRSK